MSAFPPNLVVIFSNDDVFRSSLGLLGQHPNSTATISLVVLQYKNARPISLIELKSKPGQTIPTTILTSTEASFDKNPKARTFSKHSLVATSEHVLQQDHQPRPPGPLHAHSPRGPEQPRSAPGLPRPQRLLRPKARLHRVLRHPDMPRHRRPRLEVPAPRGGGGARGCHGY